MLGIHWVGLTEQNLGKAALSAALFAILWVLRRIARSALKTIVPGETQRVIITRFWGHQAINVAAFAITLFALASIWFDDPGRLATAIGLVGAGLAFALQRVVTAFAGYVVVLNGGLFTVGDRINMGGVRGDVLSLGFMQTTLLEMGVAPGTDAGPAVWVKSRQFTGRIVTVSNAKIFDEPVYNYTRDFPFIWEELHVPIGYGADRSRAEAILLQAAGRHAIDPATISAQAARTIERRFDVHQLDFDPRVYMSISDDYLSLTLRFAVHDHGTRAVKDHMTRDILEALDAAGIEIAPKALRVTSPPASRSRGPATTATHKTSQT